jgi:hypothetical protein
MDDSAVDSATTRQSILYVPAGQDRFGERRGLGVGAIEFKVTPQDGSGDLLILENVFHARGGPARHLHYHQDEQECPHPPDFRHEIKGVVTRR